MDKKRNRAAQVNALCKRLKITNVECYHACAGRTLAINGYVDGDVGDDHDDLVKINVDVEMGDLGTAESTTTTTTTTTTSSSSSSSSSIASISSPIPPVPPKKKKRRKRADQIKFQPRYPPGSFDRVLLDPPCSGMGLRPRWKESVVFPLYELKVFLTKFFIIK